MRAVVCSGPGGPEVLRLAEVSEPTPGAHEVVLEVHASALNRADLLQRRGLYPPPPGESEILGLECAGTVARLGPGARRFALGQRVMALLAGGGYAEQVAVHESLLMPVPEGLSFEAAAAVPEAFLTANEALSTEAVLVPGEQLLVTAAASGVGSAVVQIAKLRGARVIASASPSKLAFVKSLGADVVLDREAPDYVDTVLGFTGGHGVDAIVDFVGASALARHQACLASQGRLVVVGLLGGAAAPLDLGRLLLFRQRVCGLVMRSRSLADKAEMVARFMRELWPALAEGSLSPKLDQTFPLSEVGMAHARMERRENAGKIVLRVR